METNIIFCVLAQLLICCHVSGHSTVWVVYTADSKFEIATTQPDDFVATASFDNNINKTGWANLDVTTNYGKYIRYSDSLQAYAAGFVEGYVTRELMQMHWTNTLAGYCQGPKLTDQCVKLKFFLGENLLWMKNKIKDPGASSIWYHVQLYLEQMAGLQDGYHENSGSLNIDIDVFGIYLWQVAGDLEDLNQLFSGVFRGSEDPSLRAGAGRCSALLRLLPGNKDLLVAQDTWNDLPSMLRILKRYSFQFHMAPGSPVTSNFIPGHTMTFSSYPGMIMSGDDFYTISSGLVSQETTIGNSNPALLSDITSMSLLEGFRSMIANRLAKSGQEWAKIFEQFNSGTYNNQWMIVDFKRFVPLQTSPIPGMFYLIEQIPGTVKYDDLTDMLYKQTYYGSYNTAYFSEIFNKSGMPAQVKKYGDWFTYDKTPRALIFKRDAPKVTDLNSMTKLMRYNNFKVDPLSQCNCSPPYSAENAIACRDDLNPVNGTYAFGALGHRPHVATDMKLTNYFLASSLSFLAISGPTNDDLPPFQWSKSDYKDMSHVGHPDLWVFPRILFNGTSPMAWKIVQ